MNNAKYTFNIMILMIGILLAFSACGRSSSHCYLCQSVPAGAPCIVDLSTGDIAELTISDNNGAVTWTSAGNARIVIEPYKARVTIPAETQEVNTALFCKDCMALIEATPNTGYVLADLHALDNVRLYPIVVDTFLNILNYNISIQANTDSGSIEINVQN